MSENSINLVNESGKIVAKDTETGETIPIEFGDAIINNLESEEATIGDGTGNPTSFGGEVDMPSLKIREQTYIDLQLAPASQSLSTDNREILKLVENKFDNLDEWNDENHTFTPIDKNNYLIIVTVQFDSPNNGDDIEIRLYDKATDTTFSAVGNTNVQQNVRSGVKTLKLVAEGEIEPTDTVGIAVQNIGSNDSIGKAQMRIMQNSLKMK